MPSGRARWSHDGRVLEISYHAQEDLCPNRNRARPVLLLSVIEIPWLLVFVPLVLSLRFDWGIPLCSFRVSFDRSRWIALDGCRAAIDERHSQELVQQDEGKEAPIEVIEAPSDFRKRPSYVACLADPPRRPLGCVSSILSPSSCEDGRAPCPTCIEVAGEGLHQMSSRASLG